MDIVLVHPFLNQRGGGDRVILDIAEKFNPVIYTTIYEPGSTFPGFKEFDVRVLPKSPAEPAFFFLRNDPRRFNALRAGLRFYFNRIKEDYDVINANGSPSEWIRNKNPRVCWLVYSPSREAFDLYEWRMARLGFPQKQLNYGFITAFKQVEYSVVPKIEKLCAISEVAEERIRKYLHRSDAEVIHPGIDARDFEPGSYERYFFIPSRIVPEKQLEFSIDAFRIFSRNHKGWKLVISGFLHDPSSPYLKKIKELAAGLGVEFRVNPSEKEFQGMYSNCYATLFSAINEDWGLTPLESMACEKPCISINQGGPRYSIVDGKTGFLVGSPEEMAEKMAYLAENPDANEQMGKNGRKHVVKNFTKEIFLQKLGKAFREASAAGNR